MDFRFTPEQEALRSELDEFCREEAKRAPLDWLRGEGLSASDEAWVYHRSIVEKVAKRGWFFISWPEEYGGWGRGPIDQLIFNEVTDYYRIPALPAHFIQMSGILLASGTEEQRREWLPKIASGEIEWAECYSEPEAGSDLASLRTTAVADGDDYVINGQKIWTSGGNRANYVFILARTDPNLPRHRGLSFFMNELGPGIQFQPLIYMHRGHHWEQTFIDNFRVPRQNMVGELNRGWYAMQGGRNIVRANIGPIAQGKRNLDDLVEYCRTTAIGGEFLSKNPLYRHRLADLAISLEAARHFAYYVGWLQSQGRFTAAESSGVGYFGNELNLRLAETGMQIMGLYGPVKGDSKWAQLYGSFQNWCQEAAGTTIAGGTTEIRKNVVAWQGLQLPHG